MFLQLKEYVKILCIAIIFKNSKEVGADCHVQNIQMTSSYLTKLDIFHGLRLFPPKTTKSVQAKCYEIFILKF